MSILVYMTVLTPRNFSFCNRRGKNYLGGTINVKRKPAVNIRRKFIDVYIKRRSLHLSLLYRQLQSK